MDIQRLIKEECKEHEPFYCKEHALAISKRNVLERIARERSGEGEVVPTIWDNKRAPTPIVVPRGSGEAIGVALVALLIGGGYALYKWLSSDDAQTSSNDTSGNSGAPSANDRLDRLEETVERISERVDANETALAEFKLPKVA